MVINGKQELSTLIGPNVARFKKIHLARSPIACCRVVCLMSA